MNSFELIYYNPITKNEVAKFNILNDIQKINGGNDLDLFDISNDSDEEQPMQPMQTAEHKESFVKNIIVDDIMFFPEDTFADLKTKIFLIFKKHLNIKLYPFLQHLYVRHDKSIPLLYKISGIDDVININSTDNNEKISSIPIDISIYNNKEKLLINGKDNEYTLDILNSTFKENKIYVVNLLDYNLNEIGEYIKNDNTQIEIIYYSFICLYFPMINLEIFKYLLGYESDISFKYPNLFLNYEIYNDIYYNQNDFLIKKYQHLMNVKGKYNNYINLYNPFLEEEKSSVLKILIKNIKIEVKNNAIYNLENLFNLFPLNDECAILIKKTTKILVKHKTKGNKQISSKTLSFIKNIPNCIVITQKYDKVIYSFIISNYSKYTLLCEYNESSMTLKDLYKDLDIKIDEMVNKINKMGRDIFASSTNMEKLVNGNHIINNIDIKIKYLSKITPKEYGNLLSSFNDDIKIKINKKNIEGGDDLSYIYIKSPVNISDNIFDLSDITNTYSYLWDIENEKIINEYTKEKIFMIENNINELVFDIYNFSIGDFKYFYQYLTFKIFNNFSVKKTSEIDYSQKKQKLKYFDPVLLGDNVLPKPYTRICQREKIPTAIHPYEYESLPQTEQKKYTEYWNFTKNTPAYYKCDNPKYKDLNFMVKHHPNNYCIPCCKILYKIKNENKVSKKENIYKSCIENHIFSDTSETQVNRYIINYGDYVPENRISYLPNDLKNLLNMSIVKSENKYSLYKKFIKMKDPYAKSINDKKYPINKYSVEKILKASRYRNENIEEINVHDFIDENKLEHSGYNILKIINNPSLDLSLYNKIKKINPDDILLIYFNRTHNWKFLIFSKYLLARKYMQYGKPVFKSKVKYITKKQLNKALWKKQDMNLLSSPFESTEMGYFLYSCSDKYKNNNLPYLNIISFCIDIPVESLIKLFIDRLKKNTDIFYQLGNDVNIVYNSCSEYLNTLQSLLKDIAFIKDSKILDASFIILLRELLNYHVLFITENNNFVIDDKFKKSIINDEDSNFIIIFANVKGKKMFYNTVTKIFLKEYYKNESIEQKVFSNKSIFAEILREKILTKKSYSFNFDFIKKVINFDTGMKIEELYVHKNNNIYAIKIKKDNNSLIIPIENSIKDTSNYIIKNIPTRKTATCDYIFVKSIIQKINEYIYELSKKQIRTIPSSNKFYSVKENSIIPYIDFLKVKKILNLMINKNWYYVGLTFSIGNIYFKPLLKNKQNLEKILRYYVKNYNIIGVSENIDSYLEYDPDYINSILNNNKPCAVNFSYSENIFGYELFTRSLLNYIENKKNNVIRSKIIEILKKILEAKDKWNALSKLNQYLSNIIKDITSDDVKKIYNLLKYCIDMNMKLKRLTEKFNEEKFNFDNKIWNNILQSKTHKECYDKIKKLSDCIFSSKNYKINNVPTGYLCDNYNSEYCDKNKLIIKNVKHYINMLTEDLFNPNKRILLEKKILLQYNYINSSDIHKKEDETMYVIYIS